MVDQCLQGYNGSIFAFGKTGAGKTFTIQGPSVMHSENDMVTDQQHHTHEKRGLLPRSFEYLFNQIYKIKQYHNMGAVKGNKSAR